MHPDLETIRTALHSGQISATKVDAQRAFERVAARLNHYQRPAEPNTGVPGATISDAFPWDTCEVGFFIDHYKAGMETVGGDDLWPVGWRIVRIDRVTTARCWKVVFSVLPCSDLVSDGKTVERILRRLGWLHR